MRGMIVGMIGLLPSLAAGQDAERPVQQQYEALAAEYKAAMKTWEKQFNLEDDRNAPEAYKEARYRDWPGWAFAPRFVQVAEFHPKEPAAMDALLKVVDELGNSVGNEDILIAPHYERALGLLVRDHLDDDRLKQACGDVAYRLSPTSEAFLRTVAEKGRSRDVRGMACLGLARYLAAKAEIAEKPWFEDQEKMKDPFSRFIRSRYDPALFVYVRESRPRESNAEALKLYERALKDYADVVYRQDPHQPDRRLRIRDIARPELTNLRAKLGEPAPQAGGNPDDGPRSPDGRSAGP